MKILWVAKEGMLREMTQALLLHEGYRVDNCEDELTGRQNAEKGVYDLVIAHVPDQNGMVRALRSARCMTPILLLTEEGDVQQRVEALNAGADCCLQKNYDNQELLAWIYALLRRNGNQVNELALGNTHLDLGSSLLICGEKSVRLSAREYDVLRTLLVYKDRIVSKDLILGRVWGYESSASENHVEVYIGFLRKKLRSVDSNVNITSIRRMGYHLEVMK